MLPYIIHMEYLWRFSENQKIKKFTKSVRREGKLSHYKYHTHTLMSFLIDITPNMWYLSSSLLLLYVVIEWNVNKSVEWKTECIPSSAADNIIKVTSRKIKLFRWYAQAKNFPPNKALSCHTIRCESYRYQFQSLRSRSSRLIECIGPLAI